MMTTMTMPKAGQEHIEEQQPDMNIPFNKFDKVRPSVYASQNEDLNRKYLKGRSRDIPQMLNLSSMRQKD